MYVSYNPRNFEFPNTIIERDDPNVTLQHLISNLSYMPSTSVPYPCLLVQLSIIPKVTRQCLRELLVQQYWNSLLLFFMILFTIASSHLFLHFSVMSFLVLILVAQQICPLCWWLPFSQWQFLMHFHTQSHCNSSTKTLFHSSSLSKVLIWQDWAFKACIKKAWWNK